MLTRNIFPFETQAFTVSLILHMHTLQILQVSITLLINNIEFTLTIFWIQILFFLNVSILIMSLTITSKVRIPVTIFTIYAALVVVIEVCLDLHLILIYGRGALTFSSIVNGIVVTITGP
ncbi:hypothetical protein EWM64_g6976 [Hericium alpestre]|uniref:Uncharacterized protein n=1 Tax=Hericium alpestre TaxID=135208 RepID=A0A4Y9ZS35_9AGAM|nr:hypothetical protein EWM64_g6976 [Hericium alpestre]